MKCRVLNCKSTNFSTSKCSFFSFPVDDAVARKWVEFCRQTKHFNLYTSVVCMKHFTDNDFQNLGQYKMGLATYLKLNRGAVPTIYNCDEPAAESQALEKINLPVQPEGGLSECKKKNRREDDADDDVVDYTVDDTFDDAADDVVYDVPSPSRFFQYDSSIHEDEVLESEIADLKLENSVLQKENGKLSADLRSLKRQCDLQIKRIESMACEMRNMEDKLGSLFTKGQIRKLKAGTKSKNWVEEDIVQSISLYAASPKAYRLLYKQSFPLPAVRTLHCWAQKLTFSRGLMQPVFRLLAATTHMNEVHKLSVLSFDEMKLRKSYCYDVSSISALSTVNYVQVAMLRGLMSKWKQPVFYDFDRKMTADLIQQILLQSHGCGYNIVAVVCDLEGVNRSLFYELGVTEGQPWFIFNNQKVFVFSNVPHLLKLLRNHFLDQGFLIREKPVKKEIISELLSCTSGDLTITHKISGSHLSVAGAQRLKVKIAAELFSRTVAQAITRAASLGHLRQQNWRECSQLLKVTNDWFDLFNVKEPHAGSRTRCHAYGLAIEEQDKILDEMSNLMKNMRVMGRFRLLPFQKGIIQTNKALRMMLQEVKARFSIKYVLTNHLNKDILEKFFQLIRPKGGVHDHPDQQEFKHRLRLYLLGYNKGAMSDSKNVEGDDAPDIEVTQPSLTGLMLKNLNCQPELYPIEEVDLGDLEFDRLENLNEYICHKLQDDIPSTSFRGNDAQSVSWTAHLNEGALTIPSSSMMGNIWHLESILRK